MHLRTRTGADGTDRHVTHLLAVGAVAIALTAGCAATSAPPADSDPVRTSEVRVDDDVFGPAAVEVAAGTEVTWTWVGDNAHNVHADAFSSETQTSGTFSHTFAEEGTYEYVCTLHAGMTGTVMVTAAPSGEAT